MSALPRGSCSALMVGLALTAPAGAEPGFQDPLPPGALHRLGTLRFHQPGQVATEVRLRLERILARVDSQESTRLRTRALEVLEWIDTPDARRLLHSLAQQYSNTALGQAARDTFDRLARQASKKRR